MLKLWMCLSLGLISSLFTAAQSSRNNDDRYLNKITGFTKPATILSNYVDSSGDGHIEYTNDQKQVLRFRLYNNELQLMHGGIAFQLFTYKAEGLLQKVETFDSTGMLKGEGEFDDVACKEFAVEKPSVYKQKKKQIISMDGNIDTKDAKQKIIRIVFFDATHRQVKIPNVSNYISCSDYFKYCDRMDWP